MMTKQTINTLYLGIARTIAAGIIGTVTGATVWGLVELFINLLT